MSAFAYLNSITFGVNFTINYRKNRRQLRLIPTTQCIKKKTLVNGADWLFLAWNYGKARLSFFATF